MAQNLHKFLHLSSKVISMKIRDSEGFTLIELMIVIAILAILMAIAIPAYQDYTIRTQVTEGMNLANGAKAAVWDYWSDTGTLPANNTEAGLPTPTSIVGEYVSSVEITNGLITALFDTGMENTAITGRTLVLEPLPSIDATMQWSCDTGTVEARFLPARCR